MYFITFIAVGAMLGACGMHALALNRRKKQDEIAIDIHNLMAILNVGKDGFYITHSGSYVMILTDVGCITVAVNRQGVTVFDCDDNEIRIRLSEPNFMGNVINAITTAYSDRYNSEIAKILGKGGDVDC